MIEKIYTVVRVEGFLNGVLIYLRPQDIPLTVESLQGRPSPLAPPRTEDEKVAREVVQAMMQEVKITLSELSPPGAMPPSPFIVKLFLTEEEYEKIGKPTVNDAIKIQLEKQKEG